MCRPAIRAALLIHGSPPDTHAVRYHVYMSKQTYYYVVAGVFFIVGILHLVRSLNGWDLAIGGMVIPTWVSYLVVAMAGYLGYCGYRFGKRM